MVKRGDTLIEVTLAIGIFSMVAISVVAVMISGTSNAQTALETTLAREEIDTQAEALRFIHSAYLADMEINKTNQDPYTKLWKSITDRAFTPGVNSDANQKVQQFNPVTCQSIYEDDDTLSRYAFVINPRELGENPEKAYVSYKDNKDKFGASTTYPRLFFGNDNLVEDGNGVFKKAEGIYVMAVKDPNSTNVVGSNRTVSVYYDFYIRTCWYGTGSETPSTISTVIRLYNPENLKSE